MLDKEFENNMKENKDLSNAFAIIFGIKPEEVPSKSSGKNDSLSNSIRTKKDADKFMEDLENITSEEKENKQKKNVFGHDGLLLEKFKSVMSEIDDEKTNAWLEFDEKRLEEESGKFFSDKPKMDKFYADLEKQVKDNSEKTCVMFNNFLENPKDFLDKANYTTKEGISHNKNIKNTMSKEEELKQASILENMKEFNKQTDEKQIIKPIRQYKVLFKEGQNSIFITSSMAESLSSYSYRANTSSLGNKLIWGEDKETGETICLDGSSILAIVIHN